MNTIVVQGGGLVDLPDAAQRFVSLFVVAQLPEHQPGLRSLSEAVVTSNLFLSR